MFAKLHVPVSARSIWILDSGFGILDYFLPTAHRRLPTAAMPDTFLILLAGGIMLAAAVSDPRQVTLNWLRLAGVLALSVGGLGAFFFVRRDEVKLPTQWAAVAVTLAAVLGQLAFVQVASRGVQRALA